MKWVWLLLAQHSIAITFTTTPDPAMQAVKVQRNGIVVATLPASATTYKDTSVQGGLPYTYTVVAVADSTANDSDPSNSFGITLPSDQPKFHLNDTFQVVTGGGNLNIRSTPGGMIVGTLRNGSTGVITGGPQTANGIAYWQMNRGWVAELFLRQ